MTVTYPIQVTLPTLKALTAIIEEGQTHDDVLRQLLGIDSVIESESNEPKHALLHFDDELKKAFHEQSGKGGFFSRGLWLPNGTELQARYKQRHYRARIVDNAWIDEHGRRQTSPSAAATAITGNNVNGLRFWEGKRPGDASWRRLDILAQLP